MEKDQNQQIAYLRELDATKQCELAFYINSSINGIALCENVKAVRKVTDTVGSMLQHITNKLNKLIKEKNNSEQEENDENGKCAEIPSWFEYNGEKINGNVVLKTLIKPEKVYLFCILSQKFKVFVNAPLVQMISLPIVIYASAVIQPTRCKMIYSSKDYNDFTWFKSTDKKTWTKVGTKYNYRTKASDVNHYLKLQCVPKTKYSSGPVFEVISEDTVIALPSLPKCPFDKRHKHTPSKLTDKEFRIVSYNTLSSRYSETNSQFPYCPNEFLSIDYRKHLLLREISGYRADIICLQEVDNKEYLHFFHAKFRKLDYETVFHKKGNKIPEGLCCMYNAKKFKMIYTKQLVFNDELKRNQIFKHIKESIKYGPDIEDIFLKVQTSLQVTVLQSKLLNQRVIVANTHLYYHPDASHIRLIQATMATAFLEHLRKKLQEEAKGKVSVIFCGDFNSGPTSVVYRYLSEGKLEGQHKDHLKVVQNVSAFTHDFEFESACGTPEFTNYTGDFKGCLDYIFYDKQSIKLLRSIPLFDEAVLSENVALPNKVFPSDHLALVADLKFL